MNLNQLYRNAIYEVWTSQRILNITVGQTHPLLDKLIAPAENWVYLTAHNPQSQKCSTQKNATQHLKLMLEIIKFGKPYWFGIGRNESGSWTEDSVLVCNLDIISATVLARRYNQKAIIYGSRHKTARLLYLSE